MGKNECQHNDIRIRVYEEIAYLYDWDPLEGKLSGPDEAACGRDLSDVAVICQDCGEEWNGTPEDLKGVEHGMFRRAIEAFERAAE